MTQEEHNKLIQEIAENISDVGIVTRNLALLSKDYSETLTTHSKLTEDNAKLKETTQKLQDYNIELFTQVGKQVTEKTESTEIEKDKTKDIQEDEELDFEKLFNEKGEII